MWLFWYQGSEFSILASFNQNTLAWVLVSKRLPPKGICFSFCIMRKGVLWSDGVRTSSLGFHLSSTTYWP